MKYRNTMMTCNIAKNIQQKEEATNESENCWIQTKNIQRKVEEKNKT